MRAPTGTVAAVVLAAGRSTRFGGDFAKPIVSFRGRPLVVYALDAAVASGLGPVLLVVGNDGDAVAAVATPGVEIVHNDHWSEGIASSLRAALRALADRGVVHAAVVGLADQPLISSEAWRRVGAAYDSGAEIAVATYRGVRANPVLLGRDLWPEALKLTGDVGARQLMSGRTVVEVACDDAGDPDDIDTPEDLRRLEL